ncbi:GntR family transcriptional regulator [Sinomonas sp.]|uniref:GntR family transcriptional regulator n=1 Tax=Sinomonas sp. TaxID=1914986 RepID=UPI003F7E5164
MNGVQTLSAIATRPTAVIIADQLREGIIEGVFEPGDQINEAQVATQLNVSRGPVREALHRLMQEGILIGRPNRGVFVRKLTADDVIEVYQAREAIELAAVSILTGKDATSRAAVTEQLNQVISRMRESVETRDWSALHRSDLEFHTALVREARNTRLERAYATLATEALICMAHLVDAHPEPGHVLQKHQEIVALLEAGDLPALHDTLRQHLSLSEDELRLPDDVEQPPSSADALTAPVLRSIS